MQLGTNKVDVFFWQCNYEIGTRTEEQASGAELKGLRTCDKMSNLVMDVGSRIEYNRHD